MAARSDTLPPAVEELLTRRALAVRDLDPALLLPCIIVVQAMIEHFTPDQLAAVRRCERSSAASRSIIHLLKLSEFVQRGEVTWKALERRFWSMIEYAATN